MPPDFWSCQRCGAAYRADMPAIVERATRLLPNAERAHREGCAGEMRLRGSPVFDLTTLARIVRADRVMSLEEAARDFAFGFTEDAVLLHGEGEAAIAAFADVRKRVGWGSALVVSGVPAPVGTVDRIEELAAEYAFWTWFRGPEVPGLPPDARTWVRHQLNGDTYSTHWPILSEAVRRTTGPVLELGAGRSSTPALHDLLAPSGRLLVTVDSDQAWLDQFARLRGPLHQLHWEKDPAETEHLNTTDWGVVFVDHAPGESRARAVERARDRAELIVVHDVDDLGYGLEEVLRSFPNWRHFRRQRPWTTVCSMTREIWS